MKPATGSKKRKPQPLHKDRMMRLKKTDIIVLYRSLEMSCKDLQDQLSEARRDLVAKITDINNLERGVRIKSNEISEIEARLEKTVCDLRAFQKSLEKRNSQVEKIKTTTGLADRSFTMAKDDPAYVLGRLIQACRIYTEDRSWPHKNIDNSKSGTGMSPAEFETQYPDGEGTYRG